MKRGEWQGFLGGEYQIRSMGSVAYKLGVVAAGLADATFTFTPKHEWDVVAGVALVESAGGFVATLDRAKFVANRRSPATLWVKSERSLSPFQKGRKNC